MCVVITRNDLSVIVYYIGIETLVSDVLSNICLSLGHLLHTW